jgi:hypothetical protein
LNMGEGQVLVCEGCGSVWRVSITRGHSLVIAKLIECPLCEHKVDS